ncbi:MAG: Histidinol-phosphate aminotransferase [Firmicutes bacterium]|nr:Histidinol-phosphate aminotransferase [Bacillota bacterium]
MADGDVIRGLYEMDELVRREVKNIEPYEPGKPIEEVERELGIKAVKMASNENALGPSLRAVAAIKSALGKINLYPDGGAHYLKNLLAEHLKVRKENVILGNGSDEIIRIITETFLNEDEEVVFAEPGFIIYRLAAVVMSGKCVSVPLKNYTHDLEAMSQAINERTKLIFIANPNNPTGTMVNADKVASFMKRLPENVVVIFDEAYYEYVDCNDFPETIDYVKNGRNVITLRTFSKVYGLAGLRIGYGIAGEKFIGEMNRVRQPFNVNSLAQVAARAALEDKEHVRKSRRANSEGKEFLYQEFRRMKITYVPSQANFVLVDVGMNADKATERLIKEGIIVRSMRMYNLPNFIRVTVGTEEQNEKFIKALRKVEMVAAGFSLREKESTDCL